jgi:hypothetical protein
MSKRKSSFIVSDVKRAVKAVSGTGLTVFGVTICTDGSIKIDVAVNNYVEGAQESTPSKSAFEEWKSKRSSVAAR